MARNGAMGRDPKAGGGRASIGRDPMEMRRYQEALNRAKGMDVNSEAYARNKAIAETTGAKYGLNWQQGLTQGAQPRQQQQTPIQNQGFGSYNAPPEASANNQGKYRLSPGVYGTREQAEQQYKESFGQAGGANGGRPGALSLADRQAQGIDPRDPNQYWYTENGSVAGTLIGYDRTPMSPEDRARLSAGITGITPGIYNAPQPPQQDMTANKQGQYRLSPGMYGNRQQADQQQARDMAQYNQQQEAQRGAMQAVGPQQQNQGGGGGFREDFYNRALGMQQQNLRGIASGAKDYYKGVGREVNDYYGGIAKGAGNYYENVGKETNRQLPAARLGRKFW